MEDDFTKHLRELEEIISDMPGEMLDWMDDLLRRTFESESLLRYLAKMGFNLSDAQRQISQGDEIDPYRILGLEKTASDEEVKSRYRQLLMKLHPDTAGIDGTDFLVRMIIAAYRQIEKERAWCK